MSRSINLRSRLVESPAKAVPEPHGNPLIDTGSEHGSERAASPTPEFDETHHADDVSNSRHPSPGMEDRSSPTRRFGSGSEPGLVCDPLVSNSSNNIKIIAPEKSQSESDLGNYELRIPKYDLSGRGRGGMAMRPRRGHPVLSENQTATIAAAKAALTSEEQARIARRQVPEIESVGAGPSTNKGKGIHPRELGIEYASGEDDPELQVAMYKEYKAAKKLRDAQKRVRMATSRDVPTEMKNPEHSEVPVVPRDVTSVPSVQVEQAAPTEIQNGQPVKFDRTDRSRSVARTPHDGMMPSKLMHPDSAIARSLHNGGRMTLGQGDDPSDDSSSSSDSSDSSDSSSDGNGSRESRRSKRNKRNKRKKKINIKPKEPSEYSGEVDFRKFNRFLKETRLYVKDAGFSKKEYILRISPFLKGKALNFYTQKAEMYEAVWDLKTFYSQLFDYCFPPNYRMNLRDKLDKTIQLPDHSVTQYAHNIQEIFGMLGNVAEEDQILKLWKGLKPDIQEGLWRDKLNPDHSTWNEILDQAVRIEMSFKAIGAKGYKKTGENFGAGNSSTSKNYGGGGKNFQTSKSQKGKFTRYRSHTSVSSVAPSESSNNAQRAGSSKPAHQRGRLQNTQSGNRGQHKPRSSNNPGQRDNNPKSQGKPDANHKHNPDHSDLECYKCGELGHIARNCPTNNMVPHRGKKPPGASSFSVAISGIEPVADDEFEEAEVLESLPLGALHFESEQGDDPPWHSYGDIPTGARNKLGDCYAMKIKWILSTQEVYPGDDLNADHEPYEDRFSVTRSKKDSYLIKDYWGNF